MAEKSGCRFCGGKLQMVVDLGLSPPCESFVPPERLDAPETFYPLVVEVCEDCFLVQLEEQVKATDIFPEYAYFSSYSDAWLEHASRYVEAITARLDLGPESFVVELASNDGYLLQHFVARGIPCLGIDPAANVAKAAEARGVPTLVAFFDRALGERLAREGRQADLVVGNNVLAQVPDLHSFVSGIARLLKPGGVATLEFPHLLELVEKNQFDTIYHEHYSYFSLLSAERIFAAHGLRVFDVETLWTHGGSLRLFVCRDENDALTTRESVGALLARERDRGLHRLETYRRFGERVAETKRKLLSFLITAKNEGRRVAAYGAPGKGNTLLNYCGIRTDFIDYAVDRNPYKHGRFTPGTRIPIFPPEKIAETRPDYVLVLPWNLEEEIRSQLAYIRDWGGKFVVPIPEARVF